MRYHSLGQVPLKRHVQFRDPEATSGNGQAPLLVEEVMGFEGFSGNESILYHLFSPCRVKEVGEFESIVLEEWVPETHVHRLTDTRPVEPMGDPVLGRRVLQYNNDVEIGICVPQAEADYFYRDGEGDEVIFVHEGEGVVETIFGTLPYRKHDYVVIPRGTTYRFRFDSPQRWLTFYTPGEIETPNRYRNRYGQLLEHAPFSHRDFHPPATLETHRERGEFDLKVRVRGGYQDYVLDYHPFDVVGWDGYVYPYTFNAMDFEPRAGRFHLPPPAHQTFQGPNFVICTFAPRMLDWDETAVPIPYHHSNIQSEEVMFYADGDYAARKGVEIGCLTLHPSGLPHGPQPGTVEKALGAKSTSELAVMWDTFRPLKLTTLWQSVDNPAYAYSWNEEKAAAFDAQPVGT
jgi:homogentisate 1,2-dioxygenase